MNFDLGRRIGGESQRWDINDPELVEKLLLAIQQEALPFLESIQTPRQAARFISSQDGFPRSPRLQEAQACLFARSGDTGSASASIDELTRLLDSQVPWQAEIASRAKLLRSLIADGPSQVEKRLRLWEIETIHNLGLSQLSDQET